jgi:two-component system response regulator YesN
VYRVLIAEDEMLVRNGIVSSVPWEKHGMSVVAEASNGADAFELFAREKPDIVVTDLKMPVMGGMELIAKIRQSDQRAKIIILSCLEEFELARQALAYGVTDYILKLTMGFDEMERVLARVHAELDALNRQAAPERHATETRAFIMENLFKNFLFYGIPEPAELAQRIEALGLRVPPGNLVVQLLVVHRFRVLKGSLSDEKGWQVRFSLLAIINEVLGTYRCGEVFQDTENRFVLVLGFPAPPSAAEDVPAGLAEIDDHLERLFRSYFNVGLSFGTSGTKRDYSQLREAYDEALSAESGRFFDAEAEISSAHDVLERLRGLVLGAFPWSVDEQEKIERLFAAETRPGGHTEAGVRSFLTTLMELLPLIIDARGEQVMERVRAVREEIEDAASFDQAANEILGFLRDARDGNPAGRIVSRETAELIAFVQAHYPEAISLEGIAEHVGLSPNYMSTLFRKDMGIHFVDYLVSVRIGKAKRLLKDTNLKAYAIAEKVGFTHDSYFNRLFKRQTGLTPTEYRRRRVPAGDADA